MLTWAHNLNIFSKGVLSINSTTTTTTIYSTTYSIYMHSCILLITFSLTLFFSKFLVIKTSASKLMTTIINHH